MILLALCQNKKEPIENASIMRPRDYRIMKEVEDYQVSNYGARFRLESDQEGLFCVSEGRCFSAQYYVAPPKRYSYSKYYMRSIGRMGVAGATISFGRN